MKKVLVYGAGEVGKLLGKNLIKHQIEVEYYLVSKGYKNSDFLNGVEVKEFDCVKSVIVTDVPESDTVYLTTRQNSDVIKTALIKGGFKVIDMCSDQKFLEVYSEYFADFLKRNTVCESKDGLLHFKPYSILAPDKQPIDYQLSLYMEMADMLCPSLGDDEKDYSEGPYELGQVIVEKDDVVLDCGSNIGLFALHAASKGASVYAFEPSEKNRQYLEYARKQFSEKIHINENALGSYCGTAQFQIDCAQTGCKIVENYDSGTVTVSVTTIDEFVRKEGIEKIDFIKADIEGAEREMLKGAEITLKTMAPKLAICTYHLPDDKQVLEELIKKANPNYVVTHAYKKLYAFIP